MIKIKLLGDNNRIKKVIIRGHALYDDFGKDIVCAAVSSCVITSINACLSINENSLSYDNNDGLEIELNKDNDITNIIIENMISNLKELEKAYPKNLRIEEENNE